MSEDTDMDIDDHWVQLAEHRAGNCEPDACPWCLDPDGEDIKRVVEIGVWYDDGGENPGWTWGDLDGYCAAGNFDSYIEAKEDLDAFLKRTP